MQITSRSSLDPLDSLYQVHLGYFDINKQLLVSNSTVCYSLENSTDILYGYILTKDLEIEGTVFKDFPFIKLKNGSLMQSNGKNCIKIS